ncbi:MAG: hypothetical protein SFX18_06730 [Pirellulales bacterium]|nr:hypothetical protein [Pirellulales bacterium]
MELMHENELRPDFVMNEKIVFVSETNVTATNLKSYLKDANDGLVLFVAGWSFSDMQLLQMFDAASLKFSSYDKLVVILTDDQQVLRSKMDAFIKSCDYGQPALVSFKRDIFHKVICGYPSQAEIENLFQNK